MTDTTRPENSPDSNAAETSAIGDDDFYMDGPYLVFTEAYHLRRGYCCQSGCRHCPYGDLRSE